MSVTASNNSSPGATLRTAREQSGMSIQDVAHELRLSSSQVQNLEDDFYEDLPGMTYVRGYLRGYARLLNLDENGILPPAEGVDTVTTDTGSFSPVAPRQARSSDRHMRMATIVVLLAIGGGLFAWWQNRLGGIEQAISLATNEAPSKPADLTPTMQAPANEKELAAVSVASSGQAAILDRQEPGSMPEQVLAEPPAATGGGDAAASAASTSSETEQPAPELTATLVIKPAAESDVKTVAVAEPVPQVKPEPKTTVEPKPKAEPKPQPKPKAVVKKATTSAAATETPRSTSTQSDTKHLILSFDGTSWVDVRDAKNQRLLYQSMTEGRTVTLEGSPPFRIFLGNAKAVRIRYDGRPIDVAAHQTGLYARFVLGQVQ